MCENRILMQLLLIPMGSKDVNGLYSRVSEGNPPMSPPGNKAFLRVFKGLRWVVIPDKNLFVGGVP